MSETLTQPQSRTVSIPLNRLVLSPLNVRKTPPAQADQDELKASILSVGLLKNLVARPAEDGLFGVRLSEGDLFEVLAGGRRLAALQELAAEGRILEDAPVRCLIHEGDPDEVSLAENVNHLSMHVLDQFEAYARMADKGASASDIARRFGQSEKLVRQRLRLGRVASEIREAYRSEEVSLDVLMAFAVTDDTAQQLAVWEEIGGGYIYANQVRRLLTEEKIATSSKYVTFVGLEAYKAEGGSVTRDLFSDDEDALWLEDRALVMRLVQEKLDATAESIKTKEGWKWVDAVVELSYEDTSACRTVHPKSIDPTPDQEAEMDRLADLLQDIENQADEDTWTEERLVAFEKAEAELGVLEDALRTYAPDDLARAGCFVTVSHGGDLEVRRGFVLPEDQLKEKGKGSDVKPATGTAAFSAKLRDDLGDYRLAVAQSHLAQDFACAFDAMLYTLARNLLSLGYAEKPLEISTSTTLPYNWAEQSGWPDLEIPEDIDLSWLDLPPLEAFQALAALPMEDKQRLFAHCTALTLKGALGAGKPDLFAAIGSRLGIDVAAHWRPTGDNFWKRVKKDYALDVASDVVGEAWAKIHKGDKKAVLAETLETIFSGQRTASVTAQQASVAAKWLPDGMAFAVDDGPAEVSPPPIDDGDDLPEAFRVPAAE